MVPQPQRIQTSMTLYSENLSAMIFLVDDRLNASMGMKKSKIFLKKILNSQKSFIFSPVISPSVVLISMHTTCLDYCCDWRTE